MSLGGTTKPSNSNKRDTRCMCVSNGAPACRPVPACSAPLSSMRESPATSSSWLCRARASPSCSGSASTPAPTGRHRPATGAATAAGSNGPPMVTTLPMQACPARLLRCSSTRRPAAFPSPGQTLPRWAARLQQRPPAGPQSPGTLGGGMRWAQAPLTHRTLLGCLREG